MVAASIGGWHFVWSVLVLIGWAQPIIDFIFWAHMIKPVYFVKPFDSAAAVALIASATFLEIAYEVGFQSLTHSIAHSKRLFG